MSSKSRNFKKFWRYSVGFYGVWTAHIGRRMGLFQEVAKGPVSVNSLISRTNYNPDAMRAWCSAAICFGYLEEKNGKLHIASDIKALLTDKKDPSYIGGQFSYAALRSLDYGYHDDLFRSGKTKRSPSIIYANEEATNWDQYALLRALRKSKLHSTLSKGCKVIDVGCGTGSLIEKLHKEYPNSSFVGIEFFDDAVTEARKRLEGNKSVQIIAGNAESMDSANEFDIAFFVESLYSMQDKQKILLNCYRSLKKSGNIVIVEGLLPKSYRSEENKLIIGMQLDFLLQGYHFMTKPEVTKLLKDAKFSNPRFYNLGGSVYLITANK